MMVGESGAGTQVPVIFLMGPTGAGKSHLALRLAERLAIEIVSVDSAQVYRGLDIGTAKLNPGMRRRVPHHLIDICDPAERYSAARFRNDALDAIDAIARRGRLPVLVGGTGLYFRALERGIAALPAADPELRQTLQRELALKGSAHLHERLAAVDPDGAERIHRNDPQRLIRALEVHALTGQPISKLWRARALLALPHPVIKFVVSPAERGLLHRRIATRFQSMLDRGLVNEVRMLKQRADLSLENPALRTVGYREAWRYIEREYSREQMLERGIIATRQLAKRQLTWLRREADCTWLDSEAPRLDERVTDLMHEDSIFKATGFGLE